MFQGCRARVQTGVTGKEAALTRVQRRSHSVSAPRFSAIKLDQTGIQGRQRLNFTVPSCTQHCNVNVLTAHTNPLRHWATAHMCTFPGLWVLVVDFLSCGSLPLRIRERKKKHSSIVDHTFIRGRGGGGKSAIWKFFRLSAMCELLRWPLNDIVMGFFLLFFSFLSTPEKENRTWESSP